MDTWRWDEPEEKKYYCCVCRECGWESELERFQDDLTYTECPQCGSDHIHDETEWR